MESITFDGKIRKSGNSLVVTIPIATRQIHGLKEGDSLQITVRKLDNKEELETD